LHRVGGQHYPNEDEFGMLLIAICGAMEEPLNNWNGINAFHSLLQNWRNKGNDAEEVLVNPVRNQTMEHFKHKEVYYLAMYICEVDPTTDSKEQAFCKAVVVFFRDISFRHANPHPHLIRMGVNRLLNYDQVVMEVWDGHSAYVAWQNNQQVEAACAAAITLGEGDNKSVDISLDSLGNISNAN
jgi:hypothetical protein